MDYVINPFTGKLDAIGDETTLPYLKLDQTTPQTIINGAPNFNAGINLLASSEARFYDAGGSKYVGFKAVALTDTVIWTLPNVDADFAFKAMASNASGLLGWIGHDGLYGYVGNQHIDHAVVNIDTSYPLLGGGSINTTRTLSLDYNTTNLQLTANQLNTIQNIDTTAVPQFAGLTLTAGAIIKPSADAAPAYYFTKADGTTNLMQVDTTNSRITVGTPTAYTTGVFNVNGNVKLNSCTLDFLNAGGITELPYLYGKMNANFIIHANTYASETPKNFYIYYLNDAANAFYPALEVTGDTGDTIIAKNLDVVGAATVNTIDARLGGTIDYSVTEVGNDAGTEKNLWSTNAILKNALASAGDGVEFYASGTFASSGSADKRLRVYLGTSLIFDSQDLPISGLADIFWELSGDVIAVDANTQRAAVNLKTNWDGKAGTFLHYTDMDYFQANENSGAIINFRITGSGAEADDVVFKMGKLFWSD